MIQAPRVQPTRGAIVLPSLALPAVGIGDGEEYIFQL